MQEFQGEEKRKNSTRVDSDPQSQTNENGDGQLFYHSVTFHSIQILCIPDLLDNPASTAHGFM